MKLAALIFLVLVVLPLAVHGEDNSSKTLQEVPASEILAKIQNGEPVEYDHVEVKGDLDLSQSRLQTNITSPIRINDSTFDGFVSFNYSNLDKSIDMSGSNFTKNAYFRGATFNGYAYFRGATFNGYAYFRGATFNGYAYFRGATFNGGNADFGGAQFSGGNADFGGAQFSGGNADFGGAQFTGGDAYFGEATFNGYANFMSAAFSGDAYFSGAQFTGGNADFSYAEFSKSIEFGDSSFENTTSFYRILFRRPAYFENSSISSLNLTKADYTRLHLHWDSIVKFDFDEGAYLALIKNYNNLGWYNDANECYYDYRNEIKKSWLTAYAATLGAKISNIFNWFIDFMEWLLYGYGVRPWRPILWSGIIVLVFGLLFSQKNSLLKLISEKSIKESTEKPGEALINTIKRKAQIRFIDPFLFSLFTFTSGFTSFLQPSVEYELERHACWAIVERLLGPFFIALFITAISKTYLIR